jgi:hypothetical protein
MRKLSISALLAVALLVSSAEGAQAVDNAAPVVSDFSSSPMEIDLRSGAGSLTIAGRVTDPSGIDYVHFQCRNIGESGVQPYGIAISEGALQKFPNLYASLSLNNGGYSVAPVLSKSFSGSMTDLTFSVSVRIPAELRASKCSWTFFSRDLLGNPSGFTALSGQLETIDNTGGSYVAPTSGNIPAPNVNPTPKPTPSPSASPEVTWAVSGSTLAISVKNAKNKNLRVDTPAGSDKRVITSDDQLIILTAYSGSANRIYIDGVSVAVAFVLTTEGVKKSSGKPTFSVKWSGTTLSVKGTNVLAGSSIRIQVGSKIIDSWVADDAVISKSFEGLTADVVKIFQGEVLSFNQQSGKYTSCAKLNAVYTGGVSNKAKSVNKGGKVKLAPTLYPKLYNLNKSLDRDKDGIACEK